ncbi:MAG TPA: peptidoglycan-binding domain-containing protein [Pyrinomonadaceae bacterium]|jgi:hypothetical protein
MPIKHTVKKGESVDSLAFQQGFFPETIWNYEENAPLKEQRQSRNVLAEGDVLHIPDKRPKEHQGDTALRHVFRRLGVPAQMRIQLFDNEEPFANQPYTLEIPGRQTARDNTDEKGIIEMAVPPNATVGKLTVGEDKRVVELKFGLLEPIANDKGRQQRLNNLGFDCGREDGVVDDKTRDAIRRFQRRVGLPDTGEFETKPEFKTVDALYRIHDRFEGFPKPDSLPAE